jgi:hypothetical protein
MYKIVFLLFFSFSLSAQIIPQAEPINDDPEEIEQPLSFEKPKPAWQQNLRYGGNIWLAFWGAFFIDASPMVGYEITSKGTVAGIGASFIYQGAYRQSGALAAGGRIFIRQPVWRSIFLHGEFEFMNAQANNFYNSAPNELGRKWGASPLIGAGFYQGRNAQQKGSFISIMYNLGAPSFGFISPQGLGGNQSPILIRYGFLF